MNDQNQNISSRLKKNEREKQRSAEVTSQDSNKSSFHLRFKLMTFFTKGKLNWSQIISCGKTISDRQKQKCWKWDGGKVLLCNDWKMRHSALIIIVRQTQNAESTDFTWQRLQLKRMPNNKKDNNTIRKQMKPEWFGLFQPQGTIETHGSQITNLNNFLKSTLDYISHKGNQARETISCLTNNLKENATVVQSRNTSTL